jgi:predicted patatin/cPLA2 family phospholipase
MRGVVAGGMVSALEDRNLLPCFDSLHGSSVGACAGAYFAAGQARLGTRIFYEDINNKRFIDIFRVFACRPVMDTEFLVNCVMRITKPLNVDTILSKSGLLHIITTNAISGEGHDFSKFRDEEQLFKLLRATITMPVISGKAVDVDGLLLVDGGMVQQISVQSALKAGASHILILMTRKEGQLERRDQAVRLLTDRWIIGRMYSPALADLYAMRSAEINRTLEQIGRLNAEGHVSIDSVVRPRSATDVRRLTTNADLLRIADKEGQDAVFRYLDSP